MSYIMDMVAKAKELQKKKGIKYFGPGIPDEFYTDYVDDSYYQRVLDNPQHFDAEKTAEEIRNLFHFEFFDNPTMSREEYIEKYILSPEGRVRMERAREQYEADVAEAKRRGLVPGGNGRRVNG